MLVSQVSRDGSRKFRDRILKIGLFEKDQILEIHDPSKESLENVI